MHRKLGCFIAVTLAAISCGQPTQTQTRGLRVVVDTSAAFAQTQDFSGRLDSTIQAALDYWGGSWSVLDGATLTLADAAEVDCGNGRSLGCYSNGNIWVTTQDPSIGMLSCVEQTVLVHEIGHAVLGDALHQDPRWMTMDALYAELSGRIGYSQDGTEQPCVLYVSVWRHPLGTP